MKIMKQFKKKKNLRKNNHTSSLKSMMTLSKCSIKESLINPKIKII